MASNKHFITLCQSTIQNHTMSARHINFSRVISKSGHRCRACSSIRFMWLINDVTTHGRDWDVAIKIYILRASKSWRIHLFFDVHETKIFWWTTVLWLYDILFDRNETGNFDKIWETCGKKLVLDFQAISGNTTSTICTYKLLFEDLRQVVSFCLGNQKFKYINLDKNVIKKIKSFILWSQH